MEVWRDVVGYETVYQVSNFGRVRRVGAQRGKVLSNGKMPSGIRNVSLCWQARPKSHTVHRLVALAFFGPPPTNRHVVAHNDGNPANNRLANLRWATPAENSFDQVRHGTQKGKHHGRPAALLDTQVLAIRADHRPESIIAPEYGISAGTVGQIRRRQTYSYLPPQPGDYTPSPSRIGFSDDEVRAIRADTRRRAVIAAEIGCSEVTVWALQTRRAYAEVPDVAPRPLPAALLTDKEKTVSATEIVAGVGLLNITRGLTATFDADDLALVAAHKWRATKGKNTHYVATRVRHADGTVETLFLHRALMNPPDGFVVDHINGNGLDNRRQNLRVVTVAQNNLNSRVRRDSISGIKGAFYDRRQERYYSRIKVDGRNIWLGNFATAGEAAEAYAKASVKYHGEFGRTHLDD